MLTGLVVLVMCAVADIIVSKIFFMNDNSTFTKIGMIIFVILFGMINILQAISQAKKTSHLEFISKLAYKDGLTGIGNRTSYEEYICQFKNSFTEKPSLCIVIFDINNLKDTNDRYGHAHGDLLIKAAADAIHASFAQIGTVYRIGGDEFTAIVEGSEKIAKLNSSIKKLEAEEEAFNLRKICKTSLEIAYGYALADQGEKTLAEVIERADKNMYAYKRKMKEKQI